MIGYDKVCKRFRVWEAESLILGGFERQGNSTRRPSRQRFSPL